MAEEEDLRAATIADVARRAGVSKGTVSNYLNASAPLSEDMRRRVAEAIAALDYRPSEIGRAFTSRRRAARPADRLGPDVPRLTTLGYVSVDYVARLPALPATGDRSMSDGIRKTLGGPAANVAAIAAGLGPPWRVACSLVTAIGADQDSDWAVAELAARGVEIVTPRERRTGRLARALVLVEPGGARTVVGEPLGLGPVDADLAALTAPSPGVRCLHVEGYQVPYVFDRLPALRASGVRLSMHATGLPPDWLGAHWSAARSLFDVMILQRETMARLPRCPEEPEGAIAWLRAQAADGPWPWAVALTLGPAGAAAIGRDGAVRRSGALDVTVVDATGAGDAFAGAFVALWLNSASLDDALAVGCAAGSLATTELGAQDLRPTSAQIAARLRPAPGWAAPPP